MLVPSLFIILKHKLIRGKGTKKGADYENQLLFGRYPFISLEFVETFDSADPSFFGSLEYAQV